jgi:hypothetical protein
MRGQADQRAGKGDTKTFQVEGKKPEGSRMLLDLHFVLYCIYFRFIFRDLATNTTVP